MAPLFTRNSLIILALLALINVDAFTVVPQQIQLRQFASVDTNTHTTALFNSNNGPSEKEMEDAIAKTKLSPEEVSKVGNLVADDEWMGLGMELSELVRCAIIEEVKKTTSDFIGKDDYR